MKSLPRSLTRKTSVNWHPRIRQCARKQWKCCCLAASFRLKQTWKQKSLFRGTKNSLSLVVIFFIFRWLFVREQKAKTPRKKCRVQAFIWLMRWLQTCTVWVSFAPWKKREVYVTNKRFPSTLLCNNSWEKLEIDQNVIIVKIEITKTHFCLSRCQLKLYSGAEKKI